MADLVDLTDGTFDGVALKGSKPVVVAFYLPGNQPCAILLTTLGELAGQYDGIVFARLDANANSTTAARQGIQAVPTLLIFKGGQLVGRSMGVRPKAELSKGLDNL